MTAVFVSSTSRDLPEYRDAVRRACDELALGVVGMEDFEAADLDAVRASLAKLDRADGLVVDTFTTPDNLHHVVYLALRSWLERRGLLGPRQVRAPVADFVGRDEELRALVGHFERGAAIFGVRGQGGVGKTELALKVAALVGERYPDGHVFLDLRGFDPQRPPLPRRDLLAHVVHAFRPEERLPDSDAALE